MVRLIRAFVCLALIAAIVPSGCTQEQEIEIAIEDAKDQLVERLQLSDDQVEQLETGTGIIQLREEQIDLIKEPVTELATELEELLDESRWQEVEDILSRLIDEGEANVEELRAIAEDIHEKWEPVRELAVVAGLERLSVETVPSGGIRTLGTGQGEVTTVYTPSGNIDEGDANFQFTSAFGVKIGFGKPDYHAAVNLESGGVHAGSSSWIGGDEGNALVGIPVIVSADNTEVTIKVTMKYMTARTDFLAGFTKTSIASIFEGEWEEITIDPPFGWDTAVKVACAVIGSYCPPCWATCVSSDGIKFFIDSTEFVSLARAMLEIEGVEEREITYNLGTLNKGYYSFFVGLHARTTAAVLGFAHAQAFGQVTKIEVRQRVPAVNLTVGSTEGGSVPTYPGEGVFRCSLGQRVLLIAKADEGYRFVRWTGDVGTIGNVNSAVTSITMNGNYSIKANFELIPTTQYSLTTSSSSGGSVTTPGEGTFSRAAGTVVSLVASPASGYRFVNWTGNVGTIANVNSASTTITMNGNYSIKANFEEIPSTQYSLTISSSSGGSVTTPGEGTFSRAAGTVVSLVASPASGYRFVNWTGNVGTIANVNAASTTITMNGNYSIKANFEEIPTTQYNLSISSSSGGSVTTPGEGTFSRAAGTVVNLVASPASGYQFVNWTGNVGTIANVNAASTTITMNGNYSIKANFEEIPTTQYSLTISSSAGGSVTTPGEATFNYAAGTVVNLAASPASGYRFVNWIGDVGTIANVYAASTTITMNGNYSIAAIFELIPTTQYSLTTSSSSGGSVTTPGEATYNYNAGTWVNLVATPASGYRFVNWTGNVGTIANVNAPSTTITMNGNYSIKANFEEIEENEVYFPDPNLEAAIRDATGKPTGPIYPSDLEKLTGLDARQRSIVNLTGLEYCTKLASLRLENNQISNVSPLANLTSLTSLYLFQNQISDASPLANLTGLTYLNVHSNQIGSLSPLANLTNLTYLSLDSNQISDASPLIGLTNLTFLGLGSNQIGNLSPLANLTNLAHLQLSYNQISNLSPLANLTSLTFLSAAHNQISDISSLANLTTLTDLHLGQNQIVDISPLANLTSLTSLYLFTNQISDIKPLVDNPGLSAGDYVNLSHNPLSNASIETYIPQLEARGVSVRY